MEIKDDDIDLIDAYLNDGLDDENKQKFEKRLESDEQFSTLYKTQIDLVNEIKSYEFANLTASYLEAKRTTKVVRLNRWLISGIAASITLIVTTLYVTLPEPDLYAQYYEPYPDLVSSRAITDNSYALYYYGRAEYDKAIAEFEKMEQLGEDEKFYAGLTYLALGQLDSAELYLKESLNTNWGANAKWYLALTHLKSQNLQQCVMYLEMIDPGTFKYEEAQEMLDELK